MLILSQKGRPFQWWIWAPRVSFVFKMMNCAFKNDEFCIQNDEFDHQTGVGGGPSTPPKISAGSTVRSVELNLFQNSESLIENNEDFFP